MLTGLLIVAVSEAVLGRRIGPGEVWRRSKGKVWPLIGLSLLTGLATVLAVAAAVVPGVVVIAVRRRGGRRVLIGGLLLLVSVLAVGIRLWAGWSLAPPALLLENRGVVESMRRSWALSKGSIWRVFGILLLTTIIVSIASAIIVGPLTVVSLAVGDGHPGHRPAPGAEPSSARQPPARSSTRSRRRSPRCSTSTCGCVARAWTSS